MVACTATHALMLHSSRLDISFTPCLLGKPDVHELSPGCCWKPGLQELVLRYHPWRGQRAGVKQPIAALQSPVNHPRLTSSHNVMFLPKL